MSATLNEYGQTVGTSMPAWTVRQRPQHITIEGCRCRLEPLDVERHVTDLHAAYIQGADGRDWTYMVMGPFEDENSYRNYAEGAAASTDPLHFAVIDLKSGRAVGTLALMRIDPTNGVIEVGSVMFSPSLKRTALSTEAQYLLMKYVFDGLGYRRYEWKCDSLNAPSRTTAVRLGFQFEGVFRQAVVYKGRNRDTAWYSIIDTEWPAVCAAFGSWLAPDNFDEHGLQRKSLARVRDEQMITRPVTLPANEKTALAVRG